MKLPEWDDFEAKEAGKLREASEFSSDSMLVAGTDIKEIDRETLRAYLRYLEIQNQEHPFIALKEIQVLEKCGAMKEGVLTMAFFCLEKLRP